MGPRDKAKVNILNHKTGLYFVYAASLNEASEIFHVFLVLTKQRNFDETLGIFLDLG